MAILYFDEEVNTLTAEQLRSRQQSLHAIHSDYLAWANMRNEAQRQQASSGEKGPKINFPSSDFYDKLSRAGLVTRSTAILYTDGMLGSRFASIYTELERMVQNAITNIEGKKIESVRAEKGYIEDRVRGMSLEELKETERAAQEIFSEAFQSEAPDYLKLFRSLEERGLITREMAADFQKGEFQRSAGRQTAAVISMIRREADALEKTAQKERVEVVTAPKGYVEDRVRTMTLEELKALEKEAQGVFDRVMGAERVDYRSLFRELEGRGLITREMAADFQKSEFQRSVGRTMAGLVGTVRREIDTLERTVQRERERAQAAPLIDKILRRAGGGDSDPRVRDTILKEGTGEKRSPVGKFCDWVRNLKPGWKVLFFASLYWLGPGALVVGAAFLWDAVSGNRQRAYGIGGQAKAGPAPAPEASVKEASGRTEAQRQAERRARMFSAEEIPQLKAAGLNLGRMDYGIIGEADAERIGLGYLPDNPDRMSPDQSEQYERLGLVYDANTNNIYIRGGQEEGALVYSVDASRVYEALMGTDRFSPQEADVLSCGRRICFTSGGESLEAKVAFSPFDGVSVTVGENSDVQRRRGLREADEQRRGEYYGRDPGQGPDNSLGPKIS